MKTPTHILIVFYLIIAMIIILAIFLLKNLDVFAQYAIIVEIISYVLLVNAFVLIWTITRDLVIELYNERNKEDKDVS